MRLEFALMILFSFSIITYIDGQEAQLILESCKYEEDAILCSYQKVINKIYANFKYPSLALENYREGTLVLGVVVDRTGDILDQKILHHFDAGTEKQLKKLIKKNVFTDLHFEKFEVVNGKKSAVIKYPISLTIPSLKKHVLWDFEQIFCERSKHLSTQEVKLKSFHKYLTETKAIPAYWYYELNFAQFDYFNVKLKSKTQIERIENIKELSDERFQSAMKGIKKGSTLIFEIHDLRNNKEREFAKTIIIR